MTQSVTTHSLRNQPSWLSILRILLGIILVWKGINFIRDTTAVASMIEQTGIGVFSRSSAAIAWIVTLLSVVFGIFITVGFFTRLPSIVMIPIVFVAVVFIEMKNVERNSLELILTTIVLVLLILFTIKGSGPLSAQEYFRRGDVMDRDS